MHLQISGVQYNKETQKHVSDVLSSSLISIQQYNNVISRQYTVVDLHQTLLISLIVSSCCQEYQSYGWWVGEKNGNIGIVPKDYLMELYALWMHLT